MYFFSARVYRALRAVMKHLTWWLFIITREYISLSVCYASCVRACTSACCSHEVMLFLVHKVQFSLTVCHMMFVLLMFAVSFKNIIQI